MVLEGQVFLSYSHQWDCANDQGWACLVPLLKAHFKLTLPQLSLGLFLMHFTLGPKLPTQPTPTPSRGLAEVGCLQLPTLCWLLLPSPAPALWPWHLITYLLCLPGDFHSCSHAMSG